MMKDVGRKRSLEGNVKGGNGCWTNALIKWKISFLYIKPRLRPAFVASGFENP